MNPVKCIIFKGETREITQGEDGLYRDPMGTVLAFTETSASKDSVTRCGVGFFSLPPDYWMTPVCAVHDFAYSSPTWQAFNTREETDQLLVRLGDAIPGHEHSITPDVFEMLSRIFGADFWEVPATNN